VDNYRIVLVDDHALFRRGLRKILEEHEGVEVIGEAGDGLEALSLLAELSTDMVILDISMPNLQGIEAVRRIKSKHPATKVLMLTMHEDREYLYQAISAGADGYALKKDAETELFTAVERVRRGKVYVSPRLSGEFSDHWEKMRQGLQMPVLTTREREILKLIAEGESNQRIAERLFISVHTVQRHRANIMEKLRARNTADLVKYAIQRGYV
jgi:DNA-binding NarL/FixJ family response regulator